MATATAHHGTDVIATSSLSCQTSRAAATAAGVAQTRAGTLCGWSATGPDNTNNVLALAFGVLIVFLVMIGTIWIMAHLAANMGPSPEIMNLQMQH